MVGHLQHIFQQSLFIFADVLLQLFSFFAFFVQAVYFNYILEFMESGFQIQNLFDILFQIQKQKRTMHFEAQTSQQKLTYLIENIQNIPLIYHTNLRELKRSFELNKYSTSQIIKIETFFNITRPALCSLFWQNPFQQVSYPVAIIPLNRNLDNQSYEINLKFATWVQSGGTRSIFLKSNASQSEIEKFVKMSHCGVFYLSQQVTQDEVYNQFIRRFIQVNIKEDYYPILFIGKSALLALQGLTKSLVIEQQNSQNWLSDIYVNYDSEIMMGLNLTVRLQAQNLKKITLSSIKLINSSELDKLNGFRVTGRMKYKNQKQIVSIVENKEKKLFFIFNDTFSSELPESIQFWHCAIANFVDLAKAKKKEVDQKFVEKHLIANKKVTYRGQKGYYQTK